MTDIKRGFTFTHKHILDPTYKPDVAAGEKYATGPKAPMVVTRVVDGAIYFKHGRELPGSGTSYYLTRDVFVSQYGEAGA